MDGRQTISALNKVHWLLWSVMVVLLLLTLTFGDSGDPRIILKYRLAVGLVLMLFGAFALVFKEPTRRLYVWMGELTRLSDDGSKHQAVQQITAVGRWALLTGVAIWVVGFLRLPKYYGGWVSNKALGTPALYYAYVGRWLLLTAALLALVSVTLFSVRRQVERR